VSLKLPERDLSALELNAQTPRCLECGRELVEVEPDGTPPMRCEDCLPETGPGSQFADRLSINLRQLRLDAGLSANELARRAAMHANAVSALERDRAGDLHLTTALRLIQPLGASLDQLAERIYWNPGQIVLRSPRPPKERLSGFFLVVPGNVPVFEPAPPRQPVTTREQAAAVFGINVRSARERRHLTQNGLSLSAGLSKAGLSLIERGVRETSVRTLLGLAHSLEVPPDLLLDGIAWKPERDPSEGSRPRHPGRSLDDPIRRLWSQGKTAREIAEAVGTSPGTVSATIHRLRERGEAIGYRRRPTRAVHERARSRRAPCQARRAKEDEAVEEAVEPPGQDSASKEEIAARIGANVSLRREEAGLSQRQFSEATETHFTHLSRIERGKAGVPRLALAMKLAGGLNVRFGFITAGVVWDAASGSFRLHDALPEPHTPLGRLGQNIRRARHRAELSQQALSDRASMSRGDLVDFERGSRNFRIFTVVRIAGALEIGFDELLAGVASWHSRPLAPPEFPPGEGPTKAERDQLLVRLWRRGCPEREIAEALDLERTSVGPYVRELRDAGEDLPYRRLPRSVAEAAARRRRRDRRDASSRRSPATSGFPRLGVDLMADKEASRG
jgi:transcriptional regulator with XRE-family HTH domain